MATKRRSAPTESDDHKEEREARIAEVMERVQQHQQSDRDTRLNSTGESSTSPDTGAVDGQESQPCDTKAPTS
jgi:hypothetical protein